MVKVVSERSVLLYRSASALSKINPSSTVQTITTVGQGISKAKDYVSSKLGKKNQLQNQRNLLHSLKNYYKIGLKK